MHAEFARLYHEASTQPTWATWNDLGNLYADQFGDQPSAEYCYRRSLELTATPGTLANLSRVLELLCRYEESLACAEQAIRANPDCWQAHLQCGNSLSELGRNPEAITAYSAALILQPAASEVHVGLADTLLTLGRFTEGWREYEWRWCCQDFVRNHVWWLLAMLSIARPRPCLRAPFRAGPHFTSQNEIT